MRTKYGNKKTLAGGVLFDSKKEAMYYLGLLSDQQNGLIKEIELQPTFILQPSFRKNGKHYAAIKYVADFRVTYKSGKVEIIDVKGAETAIFKMKHKMFEYVFPQYTLKIEY